MADGTYALIAETYYADVCPEPHVSKTLVVSQDCYQDVAFVGDAGAASESGTFVLEGTQVTSTPTCVFPQGTPAAYTKTFTASGANLTIFYSNAATGIPNPDYVDVFVKQ